MRNRDLNSEIIRQINGRKSFFSGWALLCVIALFVISMISWAAIAEVDEVTRGSGKIIPSQDLQKVQTMHGGMIKDLLVHEGQRVHRGDLLLVLDTTASQSEYNQLEQKQFALQAQIERLTAEIQGTDLQFSQGLTQSAPAVTLTQQRLFKGRQSELASELAVLEQQKQQKIKEQREAESEFNTASEGLVLSQSEIDMIQPLVERGIEPKLSLIQLQRTHAELLGKQQTSQIRIERLNLALGEIAERFKTMHETFRKDALQELSKVTADLAELEQSLPAYASKVDRSEIRSPVDGIVNQILKTTLGGVAQPGEALVEIVPINDDFLVEAHIKPADIGFLHPGQRVKVKLTAYDFARYGSLDGELTTIGADAIELPETKEPVYPVVVRVFSRLTDGGGNDLEIVPGMIAEINILTGSKTVLNYFVEPVVKVKKNAFTES
ncbi:HlyD family type I secretion periplasmic adaptor subunit [Thalassospira sp. NFXS8]|uniref:HlyD family type I secretion periplasmic adaptor subunit n=1 Tax=Thalassospira sp. NFXS8 TaxID=2819093 RepID=UPI0032DECBC4